MTGDMRQTSLSLWFYGVVVRLMRLLRLPTGINADFGKYSSAMDESECL